MKKKAKRRVRNLLIFIYCAMTMYLGLSILAAHLLRKPVSVQQTSVVIQQKNQVEPEKKRSRLPAPKILSIKVEE